MEYEQLENDIVARLTPGLPGVEVSALPDTLVEFNKSFKTGKITVAYKGSKFNKAQSTNALSQQETVEFELIVQARLLRGATGVYTFLEQVKRLILGYKLTHTDRVYLQDQALIVSDAKAETFTFSMGVACVKLTVEETNLDEDDGGEYDDYS
jgi:hypothetical protein